MKRQLLYSICWIIVGGTIGAIGQSQIRDGVESSIFTTYLTVCGVIATAGSVLGAFVGVTFAFGVGSTGPVFRQFRSQAGEELTSRWRALIAQSFTVIFLVVISIFAFLVFGREVSSFFFGSSVGLLLHATTVTIRLVGDLSKVATAQDTKNDEDLANRQFENDDHRT